jgi:hypothetical protein
VDNPSLQSVSAGEFQVRMGFYRSLREKEMGKSSWQLAVGS